jgi:hypothetical protein
MSYHNAKTFDNYVSYENYIILKKARFCGISGLGKETSYYIPRNTIFAVTDGRHLSVNGIIAILLLIYASIIEPELAHNLIYLAVSIAMWVFYTYYSASVSIHSSYGVFLSGCCVADNKELFDWYMNLSTGAHSSSLIEITNQ